MKLETNTTINFFKEIAKIPRESGNEEKIAEYLCEFAKSRNLEYEKDKYNNVLIKKKSCNKTPIILQAHTDMVCEKEEGKDFDFKKDSIEVIEENEYLHANGTTLGADNGIGIAQILTILNSDMEVNIEAIFTVSEETSMIGSINFDATKLKGKMLLNLDGFEENTILIESAGFYDIILKMDYRFNTKKKGKFDLYEISLIGLEGGHSGFDIDKNRGNSSILLADVLNNIKDIELVDFIGGTKFNVIPSNAKAVIYTNMKYDELKELIKEYENKLKNRFLNISIEIKVVKNNNNGDERYIQKIENDINEHNINKESNLNNTLINSLDIEQSKRFLQSICNFPHGVLNKNERGEVTTSINLGVVNLREKEIKIGMRSSRKEEEANCLDKLKEYCHNNNFVFTILGSQPSFRTSENAEIVRKLIEAHSTKLFGIKPTVKSMHITVEVGFFQEKVPDIQIAIISPNIQGAHTPKECVEIASIERTNRWIENFLDNY